VFFYSESTELFLSSKPEEQSEWLRNARNKALSIKWTSKGLEEDQHGEDNVIIDEDIEIKENTDPVPDWEFTDAGEVE
jgi:hypothetical protein